MEKTHSNTVALILGGGVGSRLYPLTKNRSKPAVPIAGKYRLIDIPISNCINSNIRRIFVLTMFNSTSLNKHIKNTYHFDIFSNAFVDILAAQQTPDNKEWFQGTADAVRQSMAELKKLDYEYVLILSGDQLYQMDFSAFMDFHISSGADLTVATIPVNESDATAFGILKVDEKSVIQDFVEKPSKKEVGKWKSSVSPKMKEEKREYLASMGIYAFHKSVLNDLFEEMPDSNDFGKEIIPHAVNDDNRRVMSYPFEGYWTDIGSISSFFEANLKLTKYLPEYHLYDNVKKLFTNARFLAPSKLFNTRVNMGLLSDGCICHAQEISSTILGIRSRVGKDTIIRESIVMGNDYYQTLDDMTQLPDNKLLGIGNNCVIQRAILDKNVRIGHDVYIIGDPSLVDTETDTYCINEGIIIVKKGAFIPNGSRIGKV
jgi:glucose-1-phosphate adenylyltransferase